MSAHPTAARIWRQLLEATAWGRRPRYVVRDRDAVYGRDFAAKARATGVETLPTPMARAPRTNAVAERVIRTLRQECLDHVLVLNERHLEAVLAAYGGSYNTDRPHRSLDLLPRRTAPGRAVAPSGHVVSYPVLGRLHHVYARAA